MTDLPSYPDVDDSEFELTIRDDASEADRENAKRSVAALVARSKAVVAQYRAAKAELAELTGSLNAPFVKLIEEDPGATKALEKLRTRQLIPSDAIDMLGQDALRTYDAMPYAPEGDVGLRSVGFVPPYDFSWSWHVQDGHPPHDSFLDRPSGSVVLDARSGLVEGGARVFGLTPPAPTRSKRSEAVGWAGSFPGYGLPTFVPNLLMSLCRMVSPHYGASHSDH